MRLPNAQRATVDPQKVIGYLLNTGHPVGRFKARFFRSLGFDESNASALEGQLLRIAQDGEVIEAKSSPYGTKYVIDGQVESPAGRRATVRTVWIVETDRDEPRFVTAYPS
jgi:hypothetical protein